MLAFGFVFVYLYRRGSKNVYVNDKYTIDGHLCKQAKNGKKMSEILGYAYKRSVI